MMNYEVMNYEVMNIFLCCLGPTEEFVGDFWRMVWQKKCRKIVMLTRLVEHNKVSLGLVVFFTSVRSVSV